MTGEKKKLNNIPSGCSTPEFTQFDDLLKKVLSVPKEEIKSREAAEKKAKEKRLSVSYV